MNGSFVAKGQKNFSASLKHTSALTFEFCRQSKSIKNEKPKFSKFYN